MENYEFDMEIALKVWVEEAMEEGIERGIEQSREETALRMLKDGAVSLEKIAEYSQLSIEEVEQLAKLQTV